MDRDAKLLQLLLYLADGALASFEPVPLPADVTRFLDQADQRTLHTMLIEVMHRLDWPGKGDPPAPSRKPCR